MSEAEPLLAAAPPGSGPVLIYLPGMHGDSTLIGEFRRALAGQVRFFEIGYPTHDRWTLRELAAEIVAGLRSAGVTEGWLLGESFGSQVLWAIVAHGGFSAHGLILAGGFVRYPAPVNLWIAGHCSRLMPMAFIRWAMRRYEVYAANRYAGSEPGRSELAEFVRRRTRPDDRQAINQRYKLIQRGDWRSVAQHAQVPLFGLTAAFDPIVPWRPVRRWLQAHSPNLRAWHVVPGADHNVLGSAARVSAEVVLAWVTGAAGDAPTS